MYFYKLGQKKKSALIILHGWGIDGSKYKELAELLANDFYIIVPDLPGFGKTPEPKKSYKVADYARRVKDFMKEQRINEAFFIGHSFGGRITIKLASHYPKLVKKLVLTGAPGIEKFYWKRTLKRKVQWTAAKALKALTFVPPIKKLKQKYYAKRDIGKLDGVMKKTFLKIIRENLNTDAKQLKQPTLLLWGNRDQMAPVMDAEKMLKIIPNSYLKIFTKVGHKLPYEKAHEFSREVRQFFQK